MSVALITTGCAKVPSPLSSVLKLAAVGSTFNFNTPLSTTTYPSVYESSRLNVIACDSASVPAKVTTDEPLVVYSAITWFPVVIVGAVFG